MTVFLLDDDEDDCLLFSLACQRCFPHYALSVFQDPYQLFHTLEQNRPDRLYIDFHMPLLNGGEVYQCLQAHPHWATIPVCLITSSSMWEEMAQLYHIEQALWRTKPTQFSGFCDLLRMDAG